MPINPFSALTSKLFGATSVVLLLFAALCWHKWGAWKDKFGDLSEEAGAVLVAVRDAAGNPKLSWRDVPKQIDAIDADLTEARSTLDTQTDLVNRLGEETVRLRAENAAQAAKIEQLNRKRAALIAQLEDDALDPGDRADCWAQIRAADDALNQLYREGF